MLTAGWKTLGGNRIRRTAAGEVSRTSDPVTTTVAARSRDRGHPDQLCRVGDGLWDL